MFLACVAAVMGPLLATSAAAAPSGEPGAASPRRELVIVLRPDELDETVRAVLARVTGELTAARFQVRVAPLALDADPAQQIEAAVLGSQEAVGAFAIEGSHGTLAIWVFDRRGRRTSIQRMAVRSDDVAQDAKVLALEAVELIRVSLANLWPALTPEPAVAAEGSATTAPPGPPRPPLSVGLGIAGLWDLGLPSPQWMGALHVAMRGSRRFAAQARLTGVGPSLTIPAAEGSASIGRQTGSLGGAWFFWTGARTELCLAAALGVEHVAVSGRAVDPARATHTPSAWIPLGLVGVGATVRLGPHLSLVGHVDGVWAWTRVDVGISGTRTEPLTRPGILGDLGVQATF